MKNKLYKKHKRYSPEVVFIPGIVAIALAMVLPVLIVLILQ